MDLAIMYRSNPCHTEEYPGPGPLNSPGVKWKYELPIENFGRLTLHSGLTSNKVSPIFTSPAVSGGTVYCGSDNRHIYALDAKTGELKWEYETEGSIYSSPAVSGGTVYCGSNDGHIYALDAKSGEQKWKYRTEGFVEGSPAVCEETIYCVSNFITIGKGGDSKFSACICALDAKDGGQKWSQKYEYRVFSAPSVCGETIYCKSGKGELYALDSSSGKEKWKKTYSTVQRLEIRGCGIMSDILIKMIRNVN